MSAQARGYRAVSATLDSLMTWLRDTVPIASRALSYGSRSEHVAARHLKSMGYRIIARNFRAVGAEIDLIATEGETIVFVEVKARMATGPWTPEGAVDWRKQQRIRRAAEIFAQRHRAVDRTMRFDVVAISGEGRGRKLEHLRDAF